LCLSLYLPLYLRLFQCLSWRLELGLGLGLGLGLEGREMRRRRHPWSPSRLCWTPRRWRRSV